MLPRLVDLCLDSVAENLERHHLLFTTFNDFHTQRKLQFLQKKFSPDLISRLSAKEDGLSEEFIDIVVNKYSKFLDTRWFKKCPLAKLTSKLAEIGCHLEKIFCDHEFPNDEFTEAIKDAIHHLTNLKSFTFHVKCNNWILKNIAKFCRDIEEIDVQDSPITSDGVRYLCRDRKGKLLCTRLKQLYFGGNEHINDKDVEYLLKNVPSLEAFYYPDLPRVLYSLHKENLPSLDKVVPYNITTLDLMSCSMESSYFADVVKVCASVCPRLNDVSCRLREVEQLNLLFDLPDLERFHIESYLDPKINIDSFIMSKGSQLTSMSIGYCAVSIPVLAEKCPCLEKLILDNTDILCNGGSKPVFNSLSSLTLVGKRMNADGIKLILSSVIKLESLSIENWDLEFPGLKRAILKCCKLYPVKNIAFNYCWMYNEFIEDLLRTCCNLEHLTLSYCNNKKESEDLLDFAKLWPNKPKILIENFDD